jgi:hypothetical protein
MKYEKPIARNLSDISFAEGICASGAWVGTCYNANGLSAGLCTNGLTAGFPCGAGGTAANTCTPGSYGYNNANCLNGGIAKGG